MWSEFLISCYTAPTSGIQLKGGTLTVGGIPQLSSTTISFPTPASKICPNKYFKFFFDKGGESQFLIVYTYLARFSFNNWLLLSSLSHSAVFSLSFSLTESTFICHFFPSSLTARASFTPGSRLALNTHSVKINFLNRKWFLLLNNDKKLDATLFYMLIIYIYFNFNHFS